MDKIEQDNMHILKNPVNRVPKFWNFPHISDEYQ